MPASSRKSPEILGEGRYLKLVKEGHWEYAARVRATGAAAIMAVTEDRKLILTIQHRPAVGGDVIDLPAGLVGDEVQFDGESLVDAARRELIEETGYDADDLEFLATCPTSPGLCSELVSLFRTTTAKKIAEGGGVDGENIQVQAIPLRQLRRWLKTQQAAGFLVDLKVYVAIGLL